MDYSMKWGPWKKALYLNLVERPIISRYSAIHCTTEMERSAVSKYFPEVPAFVIPNSFSISDFEDLPTRGRLRKRLSIPDDRYVFLYLGRLHPLKGIDLTLEAFRHAQEEGLSADLLVAGHPESFALANWCRRTAEWGIDKSVHFLGHLEGQEKLQAIADSDAFVRNSFYENFGNAAVEAILCGLPVLISDQTGLSDWVERHNAGLVVPQDLNLIAKSLMRMAKSRESFAEAALMARQAARDSFNHLAVARHMLKQYEVILSTGCPIAD